MLSRLHVRGFKSLVDVTLKLPRLTVLFGPNAAGKSNFLDAVQALSRIGTMRTLSDALSEPIRGYPIEAFSFPSGGLSELLTAPEARFSLEADLVVEKETYRYRVEVQVEPASGRLSTADEYLALLSRKGDPRGTPAIERVDSNLHIRRKSKPAHPRQELVGLNHTILSDPRLGGVEYRWLERVRTELSAWRTYSQAVVGQHPGLGGSKCARDHYKRSLARAIRDAGHPLTLVGIEFAQELVDRIDLYRAGKNDGSLKAFVDDLRAKLKARAGSGGP
jgi:predicted ATPase